MDDTTFFSAADLQLTRCSLNYCTGVACWSEEEQEQSASVDESDSQDAISESEPLTLQQRFSDFDNRIPGACQNPHTLAIKGPFRHLKEQTRGVQI